MLSIFPALVSRTWGWSLNQTCGAGMWIIDTWVCFVNITFATATFINCCFNFLLCLLKKLTPRFSASSVTFCVHGLSVDRRTDSSTFLRTLSRFLCMRSESNNPAHYDDDLGNSSTNLATWCCMLSSLLITLFDNTIASGAYRIAGIAQLSTVCAQSELCPFLTEIPPIIVCAYLWASSPLGISLDSFLSPEFPPLGIFPPGWIQDRENHCLLSRFDLRVQLKAKPSFLLQVSFATQRSIYGLFLTSSPYLVFLFQIWVLSRRNEQSRDNMSINAPSP